MRAFWDLAAALDALPGAANLAAMPVRDAAHCLETVDAGVQRRTECIVRGLDTAMHVLIGRTPPPGSERPYTRVLAALGSRLQSLSSGRSRADRRESVQSAFHAALDAVRVASGEGCVPMELDAGTRAPKSTSEALATARNAVLELGRSRWSSANELTAASLDSFADVVAAMDCTRRFEHELSSTRFEAERLRRGKSSPFSTASWLKAGLTAILDTAAALSSSAGDAAVPWDRTARSALDGIELHTGLVFQRAAVQDAIRTTLDLLVVIANARPPC